MKKIFFLLLAVVFLFSVHPLSLCASDGKSLLPEDLGARSEMSARHRTLTLFIEEDDPEEAVKKLNDTNNDYAKQGWVLFLITPFIEDEDFEGFFVTYKRALTDY